MIGREGLQRSEMREPRAADPKNIYRDSSRMVSLTCWIYRCQPVTPIITPSKWKFNKITYTRTFNLTLVDTSNYNVSHMFLNLIEIIMRETGRFHSINLSSDITLHLMKSILFRKIELWCTVNWTVPVSIAQNLSTLD